MIALAKCRGAMSVAAMVERGKAEIRRDVSAGTVPEDVERFEDLHAYVDANEYGGLCELVADPHGGEPQAVDLADANEVQAALDRWIEDGGLTC